MKIRDIRKMLGLSQKAFSIKYGIALPTLQHWERDYTQPPKYFLQLLEQSINLNNDTIIYMGKRGEKYLYFPKTHLVSNVDGDQIAVTKEFEKVKKENAGLYLSALFDNVNHAKKMFNLDCAEDLRSDITWIEN